MISPTAIIGGAMFLGAIGIGVYASWLNISRARGPKERSFVALVSVLCWALLLSLLGFAFFLRPPWLYLVLFVYFVLCPILVYRWSMKHQLIRLAEQRDAETTHDKS